jgi:hypothetical protein
MHPPGKALLFMALLFACSPARQNGAQRLDPNHRQHALVTDGKSLHRVDGYQALDGIALNKTFHLIAPGDGALIFFGFRSFCADFSLEGWSSNPDGQTSELFLIHEHIPVELRRGYEYFFRVSLAPSCEGSFASFLVRDHTQSPWEGEDGDDLPGGDQNPSYGPPVEASSFLFSFHGRASNHDPCAVSYEFSREGYFRLDSHIASLTLKLLDVSSPIARDVVWLVFKDKGELERADLIIKNKGHLYVTGEKDCGRNHPYVHLSGPSGVLLFDVKDAALSDPELAGESEVWRHPLTLTYRYEPNDFRLEVAFAVENEQTKSSYCRLYSRRLRGFISGPLGRGVDDRFVININDGDVIRRVLSDVIKVDVLCSLKVGESNVFRTIRLADAVQLPDSVFIDESKPGRHILTLTELDFNNLN